MSLDGKKVEAEKVICKSIGNYLAVLETIRPLLQVKIIAH
jgi:hypothetical protein